MDLKSHLRDFLSPTNYNKIRGDEYSVQCVANNPKGEILFTFAIIY